MSDMGGMEIEKLFRLWWHAFQDKQLTLKKLFGLITNNRDNPEASKNTRRMFRQYLKECGIFDIAGPREKLGIYLSKHIGRHGDYELSRVKNIHQGAWQWSVKYIAPKSPTPEQIKQAKCYVLVPRGASRFSREKSAYIYEQKVRDIGYITDVIFYRQSGFAIRLYDVDQNEANVIARKVLLSVVEIKTKLTREDKKTIIEMPEPPKIGYWPEQKYLEAALIEDYKRTGSGGAVKWDLDFTGWNLFD